MRVARRLINRGYSVLNGQSERAFDAIHCFSIFYKGLRQLNCLQYTSLFSLYRPAEIISVSVKKIIILVIITMVSVADLS